MITWGNVRQWNGNPLADAVGPLNREYNELISAGEDLRASNAPDGWSGPAATAAAEKGNEIIDGLEEWAAEIAAARRATGAVGDAINGIKNGVREAEELARAHNFGIREDGSVFDNGPPPGTSAGQQKAVADERRAVASELKARVEQVLRSATDVDSDFCKVLERVLVRRTIDAGAYDNESTSLSAADNAGAALGSLSIPTPPAADASPAQNAAWWASLSEAQRQRFTNDYPQLVGNRDGVSAKYRDLANRHLLEQSKHKLETQLAAAKENNPWYKDIVGLENAEIGELEAKLASVNELDALLNDPARPDRHLLELDLSKTRAEAAVANGDVDTADHVAVFTPGFTSTVDGSIDKYDQNMADLRAKSEHLAHRGGNPDASVATVTYLGYQAPQADLGMLSPGQSVANDTAAREGGQELNSFLNGIDASRGDNPPHLTSLGHSYGSLTSGYALQGGTGVDDAVVFGSPGLGTEDASDLKVPDGHVLSLEANKDPVADIGRSGHLGEDPSAMPGMGHGETEAVPKERSPTGQDLRGVEGHSGYFTPDSTSQHNMATVIAGQYDQVVHGNNTDIGDDAGQAGRDIASGVKTGVEDTWKTITGWF